MLIRYKQKQDTFLPVALDGNEIAGNYNTTDNMVSNMRPKQVTKYDTLACPASL